jgi:hypothetical protein
MLALTQGLVAKVATDIDANGLAPMWQDICREAGGRLPPYYLSIGLLGLRRLPNVEESSQLPWVSGLAQWALAQHPSDSEFKTEWLALKPLYPRAPQNCIATGDPQYFVRAVHALGRELIERGGDMPQERTGKAQALAREGLKWQPYDRYLWALWRDALVADNAAEAAELIGWESIRRDPADVDKRNQLATLLVNSLSKLDEAETLLSARPKTS